MHKDDFIFRFVYDHAGFPTKNLAIDYYFSDGANSATKVRKLIDQWLGESDTARTILEFAAGYGAVTRHAKKALEPHELHSSDIDPQANEFLARNFSVRTVQSADVPEDLSLPVEYDAIFVLSFFSHMPRATWGRWLQRLYAGLKKDGILLFTTHGETSMEQHFPQAELDSTGYRFEQTSEQGDLDAAKYGQTITSKAFVDAQISKLPGVEYLVHELARWWGHQDHYIVRKT